MGVFPKPTGCGGTAGVPPDMPIREIVDRCWMWESHSEQKRGSSPGTDLDRGHSGVSVDSRESTLFRENSLRTVGCPEVESRIPVPVASVVQSDIVVPREAGSGYNQDVTNFFIHNTYIIQSYNNTIL